MYSVPTDRTAAKRAKLLAELAIFLKEAQDLLLTLEVSDDSRALSIEVHIRIQAARLEVESLRRSRSLIMRRELDPEWTEQSLWTPQSFRS